MRRFVDETTVFTARHRGVRYGKGINKDPVPRPFPEVVPGGAHVEPAGRDVNHFHIDCGSVLDARRPGIDNAPMHILRVFAIGVVLVAMGCSSRVNDNENSPEPGISLGLATRRAQSIRNIRYDLSFSIPAAASENIQGRETVRFTLDDASHPVILDFEPGAGYLTSVSSRGRRIAVHTGNGHIIIAKEFITPGENSIEIAFRAGDASLNRNPDFLYALFVPARAHLAFPCFDQPDLKARYSLELIVPQEWESVSNGAETEREPSGNRVSIHYAETQPLPTYLFAFAAGKFQVETAERDGRTFRMYHRETDAQKVARNRDAIFDLHAKALAWLEDYTQIPYPFGKFDFVLIPSFQFGGMEHAGRDLLQRAACCWTHRPRRTSCSAAPVPLRTKRPICGLATSSPCAGSTTSG